MTEAGNPLAGRTDGGRPAWRAARMCAPCATRC